MRRGSRTPAWRKTAWLTASATCALSVALEAHAQTAPTNGAANAESTPALGEVVVTASRREATIRKTPTAISAYGGQQLETQHIETFPDLATQSPNVEFGANGGNTNISIRGIGTNLQTAGNDPGVAFHADGVYVADPGLALSTLYDVNRVEVLRGPQGTLFGRNATGGAVNVISNTPTAQPTYGFDASAGAPAGEHVAAFASGPLDANGTVLGRAAIEQTDQEGDIKNVASTGPRRLDDLDDYAGRLQLEWRPTPTFSARLLADYEKSNTSGAPYYLVGAVASPLPAALASTYVASPDSDKIAVDQGAANLMERSVALFLDWSVGSGDLRVTASRRDSVDYRRYDGDGTAIVFDDAYVDQTHGTNSFEVLYSTDDKQRFSYILGANYYDDLEKETISVYVPTVLPTPIISGGDVTTQSEAVFGHAQYRLTDAWRLFGGARYSFDHKRLFETSNLAGSQIQSKSWSKPTFEVGTSYDFGPHSTGYLKYATGYKSGGYSAGQFGPPFAPETNSMWELGLKGTYFGGRLEADLALFHMSYQNLQVTQIVGLYSQVTNAARATINGAEAELVGRLTHDWRLEFQGGWLHARFDSFETQDSARPDLGVLSLAGNTLPNAPDFKLGGGPVYTHTLANDGRVTLSARYDWTSRIYFSEFNLPLVSQGAAGRVSAFGDYDLPGGRWRIGVYGRNLNDAHTYGSKLVYSAVLDSAVAGTLQPLRQFGVELHYRY